MEQRMVCNTHKRAGYDEITQLPFFKSVDWKRIRQIPAPFVPTVTSDIDTRHFDHFDEVPEQSQQSNTVKRLGAKPVVGYTYNIPRKNNRKDIDDLFANGGDEDNDIPDIED
mmetsp:Transcript_9488/g.23377  ORF Transcript_9488/g.23377 Transcript_9488/m.23377 type:complete len:112 (+) Transcript_9488:166-501(+)